jgi:hypothetical protein
VDPELSKHYFEEQVSRLQSIKGMIEHYGWTISIEGFDIYVIMHPKRHPGKTFLARLRCDEYPKRAPSFQFLDASTKQEGAPYWPQGGAFQAAASRSQSLPQLCIPGIREFHEGCHAADSSRPWLPEKYSFATTLQCVQVELDKAYP